VSSRLRQDLQVRKRPARARIARTSGEEAVRYEMAQDWAQYSRSWWKNEIHAYIDNKTFVVPGTEAQKKQQRQAKVTWHLRRPNEGGEPDFFVPRTKRMLCGLKTLEITAAVARGRIIMWHVTSGRWNGDNAAIMYAKLGEALRQRWGNRREFRVVEDGDRKGYQSTKGIQAKAAEKITSWKLPPRTPQWMPLDFCLWHEIETKVLDRPVAGKETVAQYAGRLRRAASTIPAATIDKCLDSIHERIAQTVTVKGRHTRKD
jgi:hypothetical protein